MLVALLAPLVLLIAHTRAEAQSRDCSAFNVAAFQRCVPPPQERSTDSSRVFTFQNRCGRDLRVSISAKQGDQTVDLDVVVPASQEVEQECIGCGPLLSWAVVCAE
jgi:hypothetical protein